MFTLAWLVAGFVGGWTTYRVVDRWAAERVGPGQLPWRMPTAWRLGILAAIGGGLIVIAILSDGDFLPKNLLSLKSLLIGPRFAPLALGALAGIAAFYLHEQIAEVAERTLKAVLGEAEQPAWALQSGIAVGLIAISVLMIKPDLLNYVTSFKAAGIEATFAARSANVQTSV